MHTNIVAGRLVDCLRKAGLVADNKSETYYDIVPTNDYLNKLLRFKQSKEILSLSLPSLTDDIIDLIREYAIANRDIPEFNVTLQDISQYRKMLVDPANVLIKTLKSAPDIIARFILSESYNCLLYSTNQDGNRVLAVVKDIVYAKAEQGYSASVSVNLMYILNDSGKYSHIHIGSSDIAGGIKPYDVLGGAGWYPITREMYGHYVESITKYMAIKPQIGKQYTTTGMYMVPGAYYRLSPFVSPVRLGRKVRMVVDEHVVKERPKTLISGQFWEGKAKNPIGDLEIPVWPYVYMYDLTNYQNALIHVDTMVEYEYDATLINKLILPDSTKSLIDILVSYEGDLVEDIINGKTGGIILILTGEPGLGKTVTAECYSEIIRKPLYVVQASQLGMDITSLEKNLNEVLQNAIKWDAILLIDECDVYLRARGEDLIQNAVVGTFLRVLEYYQGVMFLTSNRGGDIDDAIMSRCLAHINYDYPDESLFVKIFRVLSDQFEMGLSDDLAKEVYDHFNRLSGRDIKNMLKLAKFVSSRTGRTVDLGMVVELSGYLNISSR